MSTSVIVGASRGIGLALSQALLQRGGSVIACCRKAAQSDGLRALQDNFPRQIRTEEIDVADQASATALGERVGASGAKIDLVFNVAGVLHDAAQKKGPERALREVDAEWMLHVYAVNAVGPVLCTQALAPSLAKGAVVANVSARVGSIGDNRLGGWWSYRMSKAALNMATKNMAHELRRKDVSAVALHPGTTITGLSQPFQKNVKPSQLQTVEQTAEMLLAVVDGLTPEDSGGFFAYDGSKIEW